MGCASCPRLGCGLGCAKLGSSPLECGLGSRLGCPRLGLASSLICRRLGPTLGLGSPMECRLGWLRGLALLTPV